MSSRENLVGELNTIKLLVKIESKTTIMATICWTRNIYRIKMFTIRL